MKKSACHAEMKMLDNLPRFAVRITAGKAKRRRMRRFFMISRFVRSLLFSREENRVSHIGLSESRKTTSACRVVSLTNAVTSRFPNPKLWLRGTTTKRRTATWIIRWKSAATETAGFSKKRAVYRERRNVQCARLPLVELFARVLKNQS